MPDYNDLVVSRWRDVELLGRLSDGLALAGRLDGPKVRAILADVLPTGRALSVAQFRRLVIEP